MLIFDIGSNRFAFTDACRERYSNCNIVAVDPIYEFYENYDAIKHEGRLKYLNKIVSDKSNSTETIQINIREPGMSSVSSDFMNKSRFIKGNDHILTNYRKNGITFINENPDKISWLPFSPSNLVDTKTFKKAIINRFETIDGFLKTIYFENLVPRDAQTITLDKMIELYGQPDLIKIDVEGYEGTVLRGLTSKAKKLCFEWSEEFPEELNNCITILENLGYEKFGKQKGGIQDYRIQLNAAQRKALDEIEDGAFAIKATGDLMLNDLTAYKFYRDINTKFGYANASELERLRKLSTNKKVSEDERVFASKLYKEYKNSGRKTYDELTPEEQADFVQIDFKKIPKTGLQKYGDLAGRWIPKDIAEDIIVTRKFTDGEGFFGTIYNNKYFQEYRRYNAMWKRTKTSWNPTVHTNNIMSNFFLLDIYNVPVDTFLEHGLKVYTKKGQENLNKLDLGFGESNTYEDLVRLGVFDAGLAKAELRIGDADWKTTYLKKFHALKLRRRFEKTGSLATRSLPGKFEEDALGEADDIIEMSVDIAGKNYQKYVDWIKNKNPIKWLDKTATDLYQREDQMFRVAMYIDRVQKRMPELDQLTKGSPEYNRAIEEIKRSAADEAKKGFIDYNIQPPLINFIRDTGLPFFSYTYRIIPILAKTATLQPSKFAKWAALGYALDYAGRERTKQETEYERALMDEKRLSRAFGLPFMPPTFIKLGDPLRSAEVFAQKRFDFALGWGLDRDENGNKLPQTSHFMDTTRFIPGADMLGQTTPEQGGKIAGLPAPFQPTGGLAGEFFLPLLTGKDPFTGKLIPEDQAGIFSTLFGADRLDFSFARLVPNNPLLGISGLQKLFGSDERTDFYDSWAHKKIMNALERRPDSSAYTPDLSVLNAIVQTVGIKIWPIDTQKLRAVYTSKYQKDIRDLEDLIKKREKEIAKYRGTDLYDKKEEKKREYAEELKARMEDILIEARIVDAKQFKRRKRKFGEVPAAILGLNDE